MCSGQTGYRNGKWGLCKTRGRITVAGGDREGGMWPWYSSGTRLAIGMFCEAFCHEDAQP